MRASLRVPAAVPVAILLACLGAACDDPTAPTGEVRVTVATTGLDPDANGYEAVIDDRISIRLSPNGAAPPLAVRTGPHEILLREMSTNCTAAGENPRTIHVVEGGRAEVDFSVSCEERLGTVRVHVATTGVDTDTDGYLVAVGTAEPVAVSPTGSVAVAGLREGQVGVSLTGVDANCLVESPHPRSVTVTFRTTTVVGIGVECRGTAAVRATVGTTGVDFPAGYEVHVARVGTQDEYWRSLPANGEATIGALAAGDYDVSISPRAPNCALDGTVPRRVSPGRSETALVGFSVSCVTAPLLMFSIHEASQGAGADVATAKSNGSGYTIVSGGPQNDVDPEWAPGGAKVVFSSDRDANAEIYTMNSDGTGVTRLTNEAAADGQPTWSSDGARIAFVSARDGNAEIYAMNADGTGLTRLTNDAAVDGEPAWSPDGTKIAFRSDRDGDAEIYVMNADGSDARALTDDAAQDGGPAWSPDGTRIAFARCNDDYCDVGHLVVMKSDGSDATSIFSWPRIHQPAWSPNGEWIAFAAGCDYYSYCYYWYPGLWLVRDDGTDAYQPLTTTISSPSWRR